MNWKKPVFMLGAVLLCTSLLMANTPPGQTTATAEQVAPAKVIATQITPLDAAKPAGKMPGVPAKRNAVANQAASTTAVLTSQRGGTIDILIFTDDYPTETSWDVQDEGGSVICSGAGYSTGLFLYEETCDVDPAGCYTFTIYDAYGDGICCAYGDGWYEVYFGGNLICSGGAFGASESCEGIGDGCVWDDGACCVNQECAGDMIEPDCDALNGVFYAGETCASFSCPVSSVECPPGTLFGQNPTMPEGVWSFGNADADANGSNYLRAESFTVDGDICDIHWWGIFAYLGGGWENCTESDPTFEIKFYLDGGGAPGTEVCSYTVVPTMVPTGDVYLDLFELVYFTVELLNPCCVITDGWVSIQGFGDTTCWFMWGASPDGDGSSFFSNNGVPEGYFYDNALCLTGEYVERFGSCCDDSDGSCVDNVEQQECPPPMRFTENTLCAALDPACGLIPGACCYDDFTCAITTEAECTGDWLGDYTTCDMCPPSGACCIDYICVGTMAEADCAGPWFEGETCPAFVCPETEADFIVTAPYDGEIRDTCGAVNDCGLGASEDHTYEVIIPTNGTWTFSLCDGSTTYDSYLYLGTTLCSSDIAINDDFCGLQSEITADLVMGNYFLTVAGYSSSCGVYALDIWEVIPPSGACCVDEVCVVTNTELECGLLGGQWYEGMDCPGFDCPIPGECDFCEDPCIVTGPYPVTVPGTCVGMTIDCPGVLDWTAMWYEIELPYSENNLSISYCPTAADLYTVGIVRYDACGECPSYLIAALYTFTYGTCPGGWTGCDMEWNGIPGPGTTLVPAYLVDAGLNPLSFNATINVTENLPPIGACCVDMVCVETDTLPECNALGGNWYEGADCSNFTCPTPCGECPAGGIDELEACGDDTNGGCNAVPEVFEAIECNTTICGTSWFDGSTRDTDWFELVLTEASVITMSLEAEFDALFGKIGQIVPGVPGCANTTGSVDPYAIPLECQWTTLSTECLPAGTYYIFVAPQFTNNYTCPSNYVLTVECEPCLFLGACCYNEGVDCVDNEIADCDALGGIWYPDRDCASFQCPIPCTESQIDITLLTDTWATETSWEVTDHATGVVICSGSGYANSTMYYLVCCIAFTDCVDFTLYDSYGDGIYAPGGFIVYLDGVELANTMGGGFTGDVFNLDNFGGGCVVPTGACCVDLVCVATNEEAECDYLGGQWTEGATCPEYECPVCEHCTPCYSDLDDDFMTNVTFNTINNETGPEGAPCSYGDYSYMSTEVEAEETYQISVSVDGNGVWTQYVTVFIDWNGDCEFEDVYQLGSVVTNPGIPQTITGDILIPANAAGTARMRVIERYSAASIDPCEVYTYGEAEDYTLIVGPGICGDLDYDGDVDIDDFFEFLDAFGTCDGDLKYNPDCDFDGDACVTLVDYQAWMACYLDANGKAFVPVMNRVNSRPAGQQAPRARILP